MQNNRALILRSNRFLISSLFDKGLITNAHMEAANEKFIEATHNLDSYRNTSILKILVHDLKALDEDTLLSHTLEEYKIGLIDLKQVEIRELSSVQLDISLCWSTLTVPFDEVDQTFMLATCYYMSSPALKYWQELLGGKVIWYATSLASIIDCLNRVEERIQTSEPTTD